MTTTDHNDMTTGTGTSLNDYAKTLDFKWFEEPLADRVYRNLGGWYRLGNRMYNAPLKSNPTILNFRAWLFDTRTVPFKGEVPEIKETSTLHVGDTLYHPERGLYYAVSGFLQNETRYFCFGDAYRIKPSRWDAFFARHPKLSNIKARIDSAIRGWNNPYREERDYD